MSSSSLLASGNPIQALLDPGAETVKQVSSPSFTLLLPCYPVWHQDGRQQLPLTLSPCYSPDPITQPLWANGI